MYIHICYLCPYRYTDVVCLLTEWYDTKSNIKLGGFQSQLQASYVSSHTEELWYNETVCRWLYIYIGGWGIRKQARNKSKIPEQLVPTRKKKPPHTYLLSTFFHSHRNWMKRIKQVVLTLEVSCVLVLFLFHPTTSHNWHSSCQWLYYNSFIINCFFFLYPKLSNMKYYSFIVQHNFSCAWSCNKKGNIDSRPCIY